jgi:hypothetical protein
VTTRANPAICRLRTEPYLQCWMFVEELNQIAAHVRQTGTRELLTLCVSTRLYPSLNPGRDSPQSKFTIHGFQHQHRGMCGRSAEYANKPHNAAKAWTFLRNATFRAMPHHSTPRRSALHLCRMTPHLCRSSCNRFRTKELGQATLLHKTIHFKCDKSGFCVALMQQGFCTLWISFRTLSVD